VKSNKPIIHGRDHAPGGADPIPGSGLGTPGSLEGAILAPGELQAWWRLGEDAAWPTGVPVTADFMADSSDKGNHLDAYNKPYSGAGVWYPTPTDPHLPTTNIAGALTAGDPAMNDGGVRFNYNLYQWTAWGAMLCLQAPEPFAESIYCDLAGAGFTLACWAAFVPLADAQNDLAPYAPDGHDIGFRPLMGNFGHTFGGSSGGFKLGFDPLYANFQFSTWNGPTDPSYAYKSGLGLVPHQWYFFANVVTKLSPTSYTRRLLLNMNEVASVSGTATIVGLVGAGAMNNLTIGAAWDDDNRIGHGAGMIDEAAIWGKPLTDAELFDVYSAKTLAEGDTWTVEQVTAGPADTTNTVASGGAPADYSLTADGSGGTKWGIAKHRVLVNGS
jgi:hypothetical protein